MPKPTVRTGQTDVTLSREAFERRLRERFYDPAFDAVQAGKLSVNQWTEHRAFCFWCLLAAGSTFAAVPLVVPEARAALRQLLA